MKLPTRFVSLLTSSLLLTPMLAAQAEISRTISPQGIADVPPALASVTDKTYLDMLVVYTPAARAYAGSTTAMTTAIASYVALANTCYANSSVSVRMRLVGTAEVSYTENSNMSNDLSWVAGNSTVASLRTTYGADLVCLVRRGAASGAAGIGYLGSGAASFSSYAFCVVADDYAASNITFPHEVGHNIGCNHDRTTAGVPSGSGYNYGWHFTGTDNVGYRTVMAYAPNTRVAYFSNPSVSYQGTATGVTSGNSNAADNALVHESNAAVTAAFRGVADVILPEPRHMVSNPRVFVASRDGSCRMFVVNTTTRSAAYSVTLTYNPALWTPFAQMKVDSNSYDDMLFRSSDGRIAIWYTSNYDSTGAVVLSDQFNPAVWTPFASGDLDGDGGADILFRSTDGRIAVWYMTGTTRNSVAVLNDTYIPANWTPYCVADLDNEGHGDILFRAADGRIAVWFMNGSTRSSVSVLSDTFTSLWTPVGTGDFDGDNKSDLLFKSTDNRLAVWIMNGTTRTSAGVVSGTLDAY